MRKAFIILTGIIFTLLTATCKQFTADIDDYLGYWAAEAYITDSSIKAVVQNDVNSIASVPSAEDVPITFTLQNPKSFPLDLPPEADAEKNVIVFEHLPKAPVAGRDYTLTQSEDRQSLLLTYKASFLQAHEWGEKDLAPIITLYAKDGRQFKQRYTFTVKANTPPPKPSFTVVKTKGSPAYYVLCIMAPGMDKKVPGGLLHKDLARVEINETSYSFSVNEAQTAFTKPEGDVFITRSEVEKLTEPGADDVPAGGWALYYKTDVEVKDGAVKKEYTVRLADAQGLVSDILNASTKPNKAEAEQVRITKGTVSGSGNGDADNPVIIGTDSSGAELSVSSATANTTVHCTLTDTGSAASRQYNGNPVTVPLPLNDAGEKTYKLEYYTDGEGFAATAVKTVYYRVMEGHTVIFDANRGTYPDSSTTVSKAALHGTIVSEPNPLPTREGYGLTGWYTDAACSSGQEWNFDTDRVTGDIRLYAKWTEGVSSYTVEHYQEELDGSSPEEPTETKRETGTTNAPINVNAIKKEYQGFDYERMNSNHETIVANGSTVVKLYYKRKTYTVTFTAGNAGGSITATPITGGSGNENASPVTVKYGGSIEFTATPTHGYEVDSWSSTVNVDSSNNKKATLSNVTGNATVTVRFKKITYKVHFNKNDNNASGIMNDQTFTYDQSQNLTANGFTKTGYTFAGWAKSADGTVQYTNQQLVSNLTTTANDTVNLYAKWTPNTYKVRFNKNDSNASGNMVDQSFTYGQSQNLTANGFTKTGYTFAGWATSAGGNVQYTNQQSVSNLTAVANGTVNLYAKWTANTYTVTFSVAGGKGSLKGKRGDTNQEQTVRNGESAITFTHVPYDSTVSFTATADEGWEVESWEVYPGNFASAGGIGAAIATATLTVNSDKTVTVKFKPGTIELKGGLYAWSRLIAEARGADGVGTIIINGEIRATGISGDYGDIIVGRNLTIKGKNASAVLNADGKSRIFYVPGGSGNGKTLILEDITLKNGFLPPGVSRKGGGVLIENYSTLIMKNAHIIDCKAGNGGGGVCAHGLFKMQGSSTITGCQTTGGQGGGVFGSVEMQGGALVTPAPDKNDVFLLHVDKIKVTGVLGHHPAARITPHSYYEDRVVVEGASAEETNFTVTPNGIETWRCEKVGNQLKLKRN